MTERRWKFSQMLSLAFIGLILGGAAVGYFGAQKGLLADITVQTPAAWSGE